MAGHPVSPGLAEAALAAWGESGRSFTLPVQGTSMQPFLREGDTVRIVPAAASELRLGDLLAFRRDGRVVVHRCAGRYPDGDLREHGDNLRGCARVPAAAVLGRVDVVLSAHGDRHLDRPWPRAWNRLLGLRAWAGCAILAALRTLRGAGR